MKQIKFIKTEASGNDFIIIDRFRDRKPQPRAQIASLARKFCRRKLSIGADGLLLIERSKKADFRMRVFNPDGSEVDMCGNGIRCVALYANKEGICGNKMDIETRAGNLGAEVKQDRVKIRMSPPKEMRLKFDLDIDSQLYNVSYINTGVPHVACFVQKLDGFNVQKVGRSIRYHPEFQPEGANANFIEVLNKNHIRVRTYERGVEQETLSCGSGCVAAGIIAVYQLERLQGAHKIEVATHGGETLAIYFKIQKDIVNEVYLEGTAKTIYEGRV